MATAGIALSLPADLLDRFRRGDRQAFLCIHDEHQAAVARLIRRFFAAPCECEEAAQDVWLLVLRLAATFDPQRGTVGLWLRAVAVNRCREILRTRARRPDARDPLPDLEAPPDRSDPERLLRRVRLRAALDRFSATLSPREQLVLRLTLVEERTLAEAAAAAAATVRQCRHLRKKLLRKAAADPELRAALEEVGESGE